MAASFNLVSAPMSSAPTPKSMSESFYPYLGSTATLVSAQPAFSAGYHSPLYFTSPTPRHSQTESSFGGQSSSPLSWWSIYSALQPAVKSVHDSLPLMTSYYHSTSSGTIPNSAMSSNKSSTLSKPSVQLSGSPQSNRSEVVCSQFGEQNLAPSLDSPELIGRALDEQWTLVNDSNIKLAKRPLAASIGMPPRRSVLATLGPVTVVSGPRGSIHSDSSPLKSLPSSPTRARTGGSRPIRSSDVLLDRKAFISLEKSINWQSLLDDSIEANTGGVTLTDTNESSAIHDGENNRKAPNGEQCDANDTNKEGSTSLEFTLPGMRDVPAWLKLLRLHKYAPLFAHMSYEEMLRLSDEDLASRHITKGARQKLYLSIQKLKARAAVLRASERELLTEDLRHYRASLPHPLLSQVLFQVRAFLSTPIRPDSRPPNASSVSGNSPPTASHLSLVDFNNNTSGSHQPHQCTANSNLLEPRYLTQCWSALATDQLPDIITRLIGHVHNVMVIKCKPRLKKFNLWQYYFNNDIHDNLACVNITAKDEMKTIEVLSEFSDKEENEDDEESSLEDEMLLRGKDKDKDSGVEDGPVESDESALLVEQEEELHSMMKTILDKCLSHEAFLVHQPLLLHWREQSLYLFASLRCLRTECLVNSSSAGAKEGKAYFSPDVFHRHTLHNHSTLNYRNCRSPALSKRKLGTFQSPKSSGVVASGHQVSSWTHHSTRRHSKMPEEKMATRVLLSDRRNPNASNWSTDPDLKPHTISQQPLNQPVLAGANLSVIQNLSNTSHSMGVGSTISGPEVENLPEHNLRNMLLQQFLVATQQQQQGLSPGNALTSPQAPPRHSRTTLPDSQVADSLQFSLFDRLPSFVEQMPSKWSVYNKPNNGYCEQSVEWNVHWLLDEDGQIAQSTLSDKSPPSENGNGTWIREVGDGGIGLDSVTLDDIEQLSIRIAEHALDISDDPIYF